MVKAINIEKTGFQNESIDQPFIVANGGQPMHAWLLNDSFVLDVLSDYKFSAERYIEDDGSVTLSLNEMDIVENGQDEDEARYNLAKSILDYANDYFDLFYTAKNRKSHYPYVIKALTIRDPQELGRMLICQNGKI